MTGVQTCALPIFAEHLAGLGVVPGSRVGVAVGRSPELVVTVLAVLRRGGVIVPLDPAYPPARLRLILDDADVALVVTEQLPPVVTEQLPNAVVPSLNAIVPFGATEPAGPATVAVNVTAPP